MNINNKKGFTLVELLAVIGVLAILMTIAVPGILSISNKMKERGLNSKLEAIEEATVIYVQQNSNQIKKELQTKYGLSSCTSNNSMCKCSNGNDDCKYYFTMTIKELINKKAYTSENTNNDTNTCEVADPTDSTSCLDCVVIYIELDDDYKSAVATIDRDTLDNYKIKKESLDSTSATCP